MNSVDQLLHLAVENNLAWCSAISSSHGSREIVSSSTWANLEMSPPFYPNIITRRAGAQREVSKLVREVSIRNQSRNWGIKDSFCDLMLCKQGFQQVLKGNWYGGLPPGGNAPTGWCNVASPDELRSWENAWSEGGEDKIFVDALLADHRIQFWFKGRADAIEAGFICFDSGRSLGLSNWFSQDNCSLGEMGAVLAAGPVSYQRSIVCWSSDDLILRDTGLSKLGPLQIWAFRGDGSQNPL